jgi:hypothetical protein
VLYVNKPIIIGAVLLSLFATSAILPLAAAQYAPPGPATLEENLKLAREKIAEVKAHPATGSGTPVLDAGGVLGASIAVGAVFGGIFIAFVVRAKQAKKTTY